LWCSGEHKLARKYQYAAWDVTLWVDVLVYKSPSCEVVPHIPGSRSHCPVLYCPSVVLCRAPDNPHQQIIKRLLAVEGDTITEDEDTGATVDITQVTAVLA